MDWVIAIIAGVLLIELYAWLPTLGDRLIELAVTRLPIERQDRYREEWRAHTETMPNSLTRVVHALSLLVTSAKTKAIVRSEQENRVAVTVLSVRERECLKWSACGKTSWEIGRMLHIGENTVNYHIKNAIHKLDAPSRVTAIIKAIRDRHISLPDAWDEYISSL